MSAPTTLIPVTPYVCPSPLQRPPNWLHSSFLVHLSVSINVFLRLTSNQVILRNRPLPENRFLFFSFPTF